jgi:tripartite ATP-independent transporter DctM subunit
MSPIEIGIVGVIALFIFMLLGMPIGLTMGLIGFWGLVFISGPDAALVRLGLTAFSSTNSYLISLLPLFTLMGEFAFASGITRDAYYAGYKWIGHRPGGLAMATIGGCAAFAAVCGSSIATSATIGSAALPEMRHYKYNPSLATGSVAAGGTLGILIPPSMGFILYGLITEQSIGKLLISGVLPGILLSILFLITIFIWAKLDPTAGPRGPKSSWRERLIILKDVWAVLVLFLIVIGGIYSGVFTATEAAGVGTFCAFFIAVIRRKLTKQNIMTSFRATLRTTGMIFVLIICAQLFSYFIAVSRLSAALTGFIGGLAVPPLGILMAILILYIILGCIMEVFSAMLITMPILFPIIVTLGFDPIWFGVITVIMLEMGLITPPIGMNVFVIAGMARDIPMYTIFKGIWPFVIAMTVCIVLLIAFPQIALFLPYAMK